MEGFEWFEEGEGGRKEEIIEGAQRESREEVGDGREKIGRGFDREGKGGEARKRGGEWR